MTYPSVLSDVPRELPFVIGVLADLAGKPETDNALEPRFIDVTFERLAPFMESLAPRLAYTVPNRLSDDGTRFGVELRFQSMVDFQPEAVAVQVEPLRKLLEVRDKISKFRVTLLKNAPARAAFNEAYHAGRLAEIAVSNDGSENTNNQDPPVASASGHTPKRSRREFVVDNSTVHDLNTSLSEVAKSDVANSLVLPASWSLAVHSSDGGTWSSIQRTAGILDMLAETIVVDRDLSRLSEGKDLIKEVISQLTNDCRRSGRDLVVTLDARLADIDHIVSKQLDEIVHAVEFQCLEASWRGLESLLRVTRDCPQVKVKVFALSKRKLLQQLEAVELPRQLCRETSDEYGIIGDEPMGLLIVEHKLDSLSEDLRFLRAIARFADRVSVPCLTGGSPELFGVKSFQGLSEGGVLEAWFELGDTTSMSWTSLMGDKSSRWLALTLPQVRLREPYYVTKRSVWKFAYKEDPSEARHCLWGSAVWPIASQFARVFQHTGWFAGMGEVELPMSLNSMYPRRSRQCSELVSATDAPITDSQYSVLTHFRVIALREIPGTNHALCPNMPTLFYQTDAQSDDTMAYNFVSMVAVSRVGHYLRSLIREHKQPFLGIAVCERFVRNWLASYAYSRELSEDSQINTLLLRAEISVQSDASSSNWNLVASITPNLGCMESQAMAIVIPLGAERVLSDVSELSSRISQSSRENRNVQMTSSERLECLSYAAGNDEVESRLATMGDSGRSARERFLARLLLAEHAAQAAEVDVARPILEELAEQIEQFRLYEWESPQLIIKVWKLLCRIYSLPDGPIDRQEQVAILWRRVCGLDPNAARE